MALRPSRILFIFLGAAVLGITPGDIARQGVGVILDETTSQGDRLLVWAE